jgi:hypothetical protein
MPGRGGYLDVRQLRQELDDLGALHPSSSVVRIEYANRI